MKTLLWVVLGLAIPMSAAPAEVGVVKTGATLPAVKPLVHAHSHNDYAHSRPLLDALDHGFCSVEADIYLVGGALLVGHAARDLKPDRTLESLYLRPLSQRVKQNGGRVYRDGPAITLLIDFKTRPEQTYPALKAVLEKYADMLTSVEEGKLTERAITVICSGLSPRAELAAETRRYAALDGRLADLDSDTPAHLMPLISASWGTVFRWRGQGAMPEEQRAKLREIAARAHQAGRRLRFWGSPDLPEVWAEQRAAGVDLLSVDNHAALQRFLAVPPPPPRSDDKPLTRSAGAPYQVACRLSNYGKYEEAAWSHLPSARIRQVFMTAPAPAEVPAVKKRLAENGLEAVVLRGQTDLGRETSVSELASQVAVCKSMGVRYLFLSPRHAGVDAEVACTRLRQAGEAAKENGVTIVLETHPDLGTSGEIHLQTMKRINHPNVRVNFDTGNITYYNEGTDAVSELKKIIDYVATVELKDHNGRHMTWDFPALGKGKVDFPGILRVLKEHGFAGPITMEIEGVKGVERSERQTKQDIEESAAYLRSLGDFK